MEVRGGDYSAQTSSTGKDRYGSFTSPDSPDGPEPGEAGGADLSAMQGSTRTASTSSSTAVNASTATASASSTATASTSSTSSTSSTQPRKKSFTSSLSHFGRKAHSDVYTIPTPSGIDNPGYVEDSSASQRPHSTSEAPLTYEEMYRRAARTPRKHRIASESAAAIAASRHGILVVPNSEQAGSPSSRLHSPRGLDSPSSVVFVSSDDQDKLLLNEVIYNERTAL